MRTSPHVPAQRLATTGCRRRAAGVLFEPRLQVRAGAFPTPGCPVPCASPAGERRPLSAGARMKPAVCALFVVLLTGVALPAGAQNRMFSDCSCACVGGRMRHVGCDASERMRLLCPARPCDQGNLSRLKGESPLGCEWRSIPNPETGDLEMQRVCGDDLEDEDPVGDQAPVPDAPAPESVDEVDLHD